MHIYAWASSDVGRKRSENQDNYLLARDLKLFAVADGMGGHNGGEVASALAIDEIDRHVRAHDAPDSSEAPDDVDAAARVLVDSVRAANARVHATSLADPDLRGMGTTTTGILFRGDKAFVAHVGDSRVYLVRRNHITQLSDDHSIVWAQMKAGLITAEQAKKSPYKNIISRSVGVETKVDVDALSLDVESADVFVLCSDGLSGVVEDHEILDVVQNNFVHRVPDLLVDLANERGGPDNVTVVVAYCVNPHDLGCVNALGTVG